MQNKYLTQYVWFDITTYLIEPYFDKNKRNRFEKCFDIAIKDFYKGYRFNNSLNTIISYYTAIFGKYIGMCQNNLLLKYALKIHYNSHKTFYGNPNRLFVREYLKNNKIIIGDIKTDLIYNSNIKFVNRFYKIADKNDTYYITAISKNIGAKKYWPKSINKTNPYIFYYEINKVKMAKYSNKFYKNVII